MACASPPLLNPNKQPSSSTAVDKLVHLLQIKITRPTTP